MSDYTNAGLLINGQRLINAEQSKLIIAKIEQATQLKKIIKETEKDDELILQKNRAEINSLNLEIDKLKRKLQTKENIEDENFFYKNLLSKPMHEIADADENFKNTYLVQQELLADWMVSQRAFKELAIDFGIKLGIKKEHILEAGYQNEEKVLNNETEHGNNVSDGVFMNTYAERLKMKMKNKKEP